MQLSTGFSRACKTAVLVGSVLAFWLLISKAAMAAISYSDLVVKDGPVAYYRLAEPLYAGAATRSTNLGTGQALHGFYNNFAAGELAQGGPQTVGFVGDNLAPVFDATNNYVERTDSGSSPLDITGALTLEAWVKLDAGANTSAAPGVVSKYLGTGNQRSYTLRVHDGKANFAISGSGAWESAFDFSAGATLTPGEWHHLAATYTPSDSMKIYVNGSMVGEKTSSIPSSLHNGSAPLWIGVQNVTNQVSRYFPGQIDEVAVYNQSLSGDQIAAHYQAAFSPALDPAALSGLKAWYQIDNGTQLVYEAGDNSYRASAWQDSSTNNSTMQQGTVAPRPVMQQDQIGGYPALAFDGSNDWLSAGDGDVYSVDGLTVIAVAQRDGTGRNRAIAAQYKTGSATREWALTGAFFTTQENPASYNSSMDASFGAVDNAWHVYSGRWEPGVSTQAFLDGALTGTASNPADSLTDTSVALTLGAYDGGGAYQWDGMIAEVLVFDHALTPWEHNRVGWYLSQKYGIETAFIPEPSAAILLLMGMAMMLARRRRRG